MRIDLVRLRERDQMPNGPSHDIAVAVQVAFAALRRVQDSGDVARHRGLFGDDRNIGLCRHS